jgi:cation diffusion facilitator family transporter
VASPDPQGEHHKTTVALSSVVAAMFLTGMKLVVGLLTGSLGILAEAAHSALDLVAALVTYLAVRISGRPADADHPYGHGKIENLSALFETLLLLVTCAWIIYEALRRLLIRTVHVEANAWAFLVMLVSIAVDFTRSRALARAAKMYDSQALEADALHFSTDIWSSLVVILGLALVRVGAGSPQLAFLGRADASAALGVAIIVLYVSVQLGRRTISVLLDTAPANASDEIERRLLLLPQVVRVRQVRVRRSGPDAFVDLTVSVAPNANLSEAHGVASQIEGLVQSLVPRSDVVVHVEPADLPANGHQSVVQVLRQSAREIGLSIHGIRILRMGEGYHAGVHAEIAGDLTLAQAHDVISRFEAAVRARLPNLAEIVTHIEPVTAGSAPPSDSLSIAEVRQLTGEAERLALEMYGPGTCHKVQVSTVAGRPSVSMHCVLPRDLSVDQAHELTEALEDALRLRYPSLDRVLLHAEPS